MICASDQPVPIGARRVGIEDCGVCYPTQPYVVLREATLEELLADIRARGLVPPTSPCPYRYFYEVSVD